MLPWPAQVQHYASSDAEALLWTSKSSAIQFPFPFEKSSARPRCIDIPNEMLEEQRYARPFPQNSLTTTVESVCEPLCEPGERSLSILQKQQANCRLLCLWWVYHDCRSCEKLEQVTQGDSTSTGSSEDSNITARNQQCCHIFHSMKNKLSCGEFYMQAY
jgi:hypothetical protein